MTAASSATSSCRRSEREPITIFGDGRQTRSFCYVDDMIRALVLFMESEPSLIGPVNFGNPVESTMLELAELVLGLTDSSSKLVFEPLPSDDPKQRCPDITLAKQSIWAGRPKLRWRMACARRSLISGKELGQ